MRRFVLAFAATAALVLSVAAPAAAAPYNNPAFHTASVTCPGSEPWVAFATVIPLGWQLDGPPGTTPDKMFGGTATVLVDGVPVGGWITPPPAGLADKLTVCSVVRPVDADTVIVFDPAYILLTPH